MLQIKGHCNFFGKTGYNIYSRGFFKSLKKVYPKLSVRNFTDFKSELFDDDDIKIVDEITTFDGKCFSNINPPWVPKSYVISRGDINIILNETNHLYFYEKYEGIKIAYNLWETTQQPPNFFNKLLKFDQLWVPSQWQKEMIINQGYPKDKVFVVPGGVDEEFIPIENDRKDGIIKFLVVGSWGFRKSTKEIIKTFLKTFKNINNVELILSVDSPFCKDGFKSTEERLKYYKLEDPRIKITHFTDRETYIKTIQSCDVFISCSRGEGWNIPLLEALSCGKPSIYSNCSGQLEFTEDCPLKVDIKKEIPAVCKKENVDFTGNYYEPDFNHLSKILLYVYNNLEDVSKKHIEISSKIREKYSWSNSSKKTMELLMPLLFTIVDKKDDEFYTTVTTKEVLSVNNSLINNSIYKEIFEYNVYTSIPEMKIKKGDIVLDVGAHIGIFSRYAALQNASKVISFEMNPKYFSCLRLNVRKEDDVFNCVLLNKNFVKFKLDDNIIVNGFDLNHFYEGGLFNKINFMKVDVMGRELEFLNSIKKCVYNSIQKISTRLYNISDENKKQLIEFMKSNGFEYYYNIVIETSSIQFLYFWK